MDEGLSNLDRYGKGLYQDSPPAARHLNPKPSTPQP